MDLEEAIRTRRSTRHYDSSRLLERSEIEALIALANLAPSSFNLQHWKFIVVDDPERKKVLCGLAHNQSQVLDASATIILVADPAVFTQARTHFDEWGMGDALKEKYVNMTFGIYNPPSGETARDEALRSIGLWAGTFMLAAWGRGLATGPMIGFDPAGVAREFHIEPPMFPALLITLGVAKGEPRPRFSRRPLSEILRYNDGGFD